MRRRREIGSFGLSFLDLISGAVGAAVLLFVIVSVLPQDPAEITEIVDEAIDRELRALQAIKNNLNAIRSQAEYSSPVSGAALDRAREIAAAIPGQIDELEAAIKHLMQVYMRSEEIRVALQQEYVQISEELQEIQEVNGGMQEQLLNQRLVFVSMEWATGETDIDLHIVDPAGRHYYYDATTQSGTNAQLTQDNVNGPGVEVWQVGGASAIPGVYRISAHYYDGQEETPTKFSILAHSGYSIQRAHMETTLKPNQEPGPGQQEENITGVGAVTTIKIADVILAANGTLQVRSHVQ